MASDSKTKISFWERFSYGCGDLGCNIIYSAMSAFLLFYYTDYVHVNAATIGTIMLLSRVFDGVTDLIMGVIVDRTKSRFGKCRSWILRMAIPFALAGILLFSVPSGLGETSKLVYIFITYNLVSSVVYTAINVPYATLNALITQIQYENLSSQAYAHVFSANFAADCVKNPCRATARLRIFALSATKLCSKIRTHFL